MKHLTIHLCSAVLLLLSHAGAGATLIISDDYESYANNQNIAPRLNQTTDFPAVPPVSPGGAAYERSISTLQWVQQQDQGGNAVAYFRGDAASGIAITTGDYAGGITDFSMDLIFNDYNNSSTNLVAGTAGGFWASNPAGTRLNRLDGFTGFGFSVDNNDGGTSQFVMYDSGVLVASADLSFAPVLGTLYTLSFDVNPDGTFDNLFFDGTEYTEVAAFDAANVAGLFGEDATHFAGGINISSGNSRSSIDNFAVSAVPEPAGGSLLLLGSLGLLIRRRRTGA